MHGFKYDENKYSYGFYSIGLKIYNLPPHTPGCIKHEITAVVRMVTVILLYNSMRYVEPWCW